MRAAIFGIVIATLAGGLSAAPASAAPLPAAQPLAPGDLLAEARVVSRKVVRGPRCKTVVTKRRGPSGRTVVVRKRRCF
jgi:hypothetical protein